MVIVTSGALRPVARRACLGQWHSSAEVRRDGALAFVDRGRQSEYLSRMSSGYEAHAGGIGDDHITRFDGDPADQDRLAGPALAKPSPPGHGHAGPGVDGERQLLRVGYVSARPVDDCGAYAAQLRAQTQQPAPARHVGTSVVRHDDHVGRTGAGDRRRGDVWTDGAGFVRLHLHRDGETNHGGVAPHRP